MIQAAARRKPCLSRLDAGERAFAYAKACGIIGKSFVGKRISALRKLNTLTEFDRLVFPEEQRELPGPELLADLERRLLRRTVRHIIAVLDSYLYPPELLVRQLRSCEYADLKACLRHISAGKPAPSLCGIGRFGTVRFEAYPDLAAMLAGTEFESLLAEEDKTAVKANRFDNDSTDFYLTSLEAKLDLRYYTLLVRSLRRLSSQDRFFAEQILAEEISLRNCIWALRLRGYFNKAPDETEQFLMDLTMKVSLAAEARQMLDFPLDIRSAWKGWRWEGFLNPETPGEIWEANPRYFQNAASRYIYRQSLRSFRRMPSAVSSVFCYIKLKQFEEDLLTSTAEGLGLGMTGNEVLNLIEVPA